MSVRVSERCVIMRACERVDVFGECVCVCLFVLRCACVSACVRACVRACVHACVRACVRACMRVHAFVRVCACARACVGVAVRVCVRAHARACARGCGLQCAGCRHACSAHVTSAGSPEHMKPPTMRNGGLKPSVASSRGTTCPRYL